jgi:hypothetical protein
MNEIKEVKPILSPPPVNNLPIIIYFGFLQLLYYSALNGGASLISDVA